MFCFISGKENKLNQNRNRKNVNIEMKTRSVVCALAKKIKKVVKDPCITKNITKLADSVIPLSQVLDAIDPGAIIPNWML